MFSLAPELSLDLNLNPYPGAGARDRGAEGRFEMYTKGIWDEKRRRYNTPFENDAYIYTSSYIGFVWWTRYSFTRHGER